MTVVQVRGLDRLMLNFTSNREDWSQFPSIVSGRGCLLRDADGKQYIDALGGLYTTQVGHGRAELAEAASRQIRQLEYTPAWSLHHPRAVELAARLDELAPGDDRWSSFFVNSGSEAVEAMLKICRQYHHAQGQPERSRFISRDVAYHGVTMGALALSGLPGISDAFEPLPQGFLHVANTQQDPEGAAAAIAAAIEAAPADSVAAVVLEPVQNGGGCLVPPPGYWSSVRETCDRYGVLLVADATICAFGRLGTWFGVERFEALPDVITFAKGLTSGYIPMGGVLVSARVREALDTQEMFLMGSTFGGHPVAAAVALENLAIIEREDLLGNVRANEGAFGDALRALAAAHPAVTEVRGMGYFWAIELAPLWADGRPVEGDDYDRIFKHDLFHRLLDLGLICRVDDRDSPVLMFSPPLTADRELIERITAITGEVVAGLERSLGH